MKHFHEIMTKIGKSEHPILKAINRMCIDPITQNAESLEEIVDDCYKYRWHDLRDNPEDLPTEIKIVEVRTNEKMPYYFGWYSGECEAWFDMEGFSMCVVKWREIEDEEVSENGL